MSHAPQLTIDGVAWQVARISGSEAVGRPFVFEVTAHADNARSPMVGAAAELTWALAADGGLRSLRAIVDAVRRVGGASGIGRGATVVRLLPRMAVLADNVEHRVFLDQTADAIARSVLEARGFRVEARLLRRCAPRAQCVQAFESDLEFLTRILAAEGILWFLSPDDPELWALVDDASGFRPLPLPTLPVRSPDGFVTGASVWDVSVTTLAVSEMATLSDFNPQTPSLDLTVSAGEGVAERYEHAVGYADPRVGAELAQIRLEQHRRQRVRLTGTSNEPGLYPGFTLQLQADSEGVSGAWLITEVEHDIRGDAAPADERPYTARFCAVPATAGHRPAAPERAPWRGVQTMDVAGPSGAEIHTNADGSSKARFRWERERPADDQCSTWMRTLQPPTSGGLLIPRTGWQVLSTFFEGNPDEPLVLGRLYTGTDKPPSALPGEKVQSGLVSRTTPGGGSVNGIQTNDTAGNEGMSFTASKAWNERTENDKTTSIKTDDTWTIGANRKTVVTLVHEVGVGAAQAYSVGGSRTVNVDANKSIVAASESVTVGGARMFEVGGDSHTQSASLGRLVGGAKVVASIEHDSRLVTGVSSVMVGGAFGQLSGLTSATSVGGANVETVAGAKSIAAPSYNLTVKGALTETFASKSTAGSAVVLSASSTLTLHAAGAMTVKGSDVVFAASTKIQVKAGGATITITPGGVTIKGDFKSSQSALDDSSESYD